MFGRKSLVVGALTSVGLVVADATGASAADVAEPVSSVPRWAPFTQYAGGRQVVSPNNDVVSAKVAHRSSSAYATDTAKWSLSSTYLTPTVGNSIYAPLLTPVETIAYNPDGTVSSQTIGGIATTYGYNTDGTVATETRAGVTRTYSYTAGVLIAVA